MSIETLTPGSGRGRGGGRGAPFGNNEQRRELRRPIGAPAPQQTATPSSSAADALASDLENIDLKNSFNINATEFVPIKLSLSAAASEFVPGQFDSPEGDKNDGDTGDGETDPPSQHPSITLLYDAMYQLTLEPGRFDSIARQLTQDLNTVITDYETLENLAEIILENGINEPNFRYTGARLCDYLSLHLTVIIEGATLRQIIMQKCNREFKLRDTMLRDNPEHLRGFILFLAELFQQLEIQVGAVVQRVAVLGDAIPQLLTTLASEPNKENVKCIVQTLKCVGSVLEEEERNKAGNNGGTPQLDKTLDKLDKLSADPDLDKSLAELLQGLVKLRRSNWGHSPPGSVAGQDSLPGLGTFSLDPTFYAPDGQVLTMEEYSFLEEYGLADDDGMMESQAWSTGDDPGMGDEMEAAYEEFLRTQS